MNDFDELIACMRRDNMVLRDVELPVGEVVFFKSILEGYPGVAAVHAHAGAASRSEDGKMAQLMVATTQGFIEELDSLLNDVAREITQLSWKAQAGATVVVECG